MEVQAISARIGLATVCNLLQIGDNIGHVELWLSMELALNLVWLLLAVFIVGQWVRYTPKEGAGRWTQIFALTMLILILFPVISVTDDLQAAQNPAEDESYLRRDHVTVRSQAIFSAVAALPPAVSADLSLCFQRLVMPFHFVIPAINNPALATIQNRPPPTV